MDRFILRGLLPLMLGSLACQPVIAIGQNEFLLFLLLFAVLLGPPIYRFARRIEVFLQSRKQDQKE
jgi:hypothetical protein